MRRGIFAALVLVMALAGPARAGTVRIDDSFDDRAGQTYQSLVYSGGPETNNLTITPLAGTPERVRVRDLGGVGVGAGCAFPNAADHSTAVCTFNPEFFNTGSADVRLGDGNDRVTLVGAQGGSLDGGSGNDVLTSGTSGASFAGGPGNDRLLGGPGADYVFEGEEPSGTDLIQGGGGSDHVSYGGRRVGVRIVLDGLPGSGASGENDTIGADVEDAEGGLGPDRMRGNAGPNSLSGGRGSDRIAGGAGDDRLEGNTNGTGARRTRDRDRLEGGAGDDDLFGGDGQLVVLVGGPGQDLITGGSGNNRIGARDGEADEIDCFGRRDRDKVTVDAYDFVGRDREFGGCEKILRRGAASAVLADVGPQFVNTEDDTLGRSIELRGGCQADGPRPRCVGRLTLRLDGRQFFSQRFRAGRGGTRRLRVGIPSSLRARVRAEGRVTVTSSVKSKDRRGHTRIRTRPLVLTKSLF